MSCSFLNIEVRFPISFFYTLKEIFFFILTYLRERKGERDKPQSVAFWICPDLQPRYVPWPKIQPAKDDSQPTESLWQGFPISLEIKMPACHLSFSNSNTQMQLQCKIGQYKETSWILPALRQKVTSQWFQVQFPKQKWHQCKQQRQVY